MQLNLCLYLLFYSIGLSIHVPIPHFFFNYRDLKKVLASGRTNATSITIIFQGLPGHFCFFFQVNFIIKFSFFFFF